MPRAYSGAVGVGNVGLSSCQPARYAERMKTFLLLILAASTLHAQTIQMLKAKGGDPASSISL